MQQMPVIFSQFLKQLLDQRENQLLPLWLLTNQWGETNFDFGCRWFLCRILEIGSQTVEDMADHVRQSFPLWNKGRLSELEDPSVRRETDLLVQGTQTCQQKRNQ